MVTQPYEISNQYNITEALSHLDSEYIFDVINDKLDNMDYSSVLEDPNIVRSYEDNFKMLVDNFPGDSQNIALIRTQVYNDIIAALCEKFNLQYNTQDDNIDIYAAAFYLYDFLVCNKNNTMISFFVSFIINNKSSIMQYINIDDYRKAKDNSASYSKRIYADHQYGAIAANIITVLRLISEFNITLENIFQSVYQNYSIVEFMCNIVSDRGCFFKDFYCSLLNKPDISPIIITNIRLALQKMVGDISQQSIADIMAYNMVKPKKKTEDEGSNDQSQEENN